jgi:hypothetical protein
LLEVSWHDPTVAAPNDLVAPSRDRGALPFFLESPVPGVSVETHADLENCAARRKAPHRNLCLIVKEPNGASKKRALYL